MLTSADVGENADTAQTTAAITVRNTVALLLKTSFVAISISYYGLTNGYYSCFLLSILHFRTDNHCARTADGVYCL